VNTIFVAKCLDKIFLVKNLKIHEKQLYFQTVFLQNNINSPCLNIWINAKTQQKSIDRIQTFTLITSTASFTNKLQPQVSLTKFKLLHSNT
jgi:hypothetical protein